MGPQRKWWGRAIALGSIAVRHSRPPPSRRVNKRWSQCQRSFVTETGKLIASEHYTGGQGQTSSVSEKKKKKYLPTPIQYCKFGVIRRRP